MAQLHWLGIGLVSAMATIAPSVSAAQAHQDPLPTGAGKAELVSDCTSCHGIDVMITQKRTKAEWDDIMTRMVGYGATSDAAKQKVITDYLRNHFGKASDDHS